MIDTRTPRNARTEYSGRLVGLGDGRSCGHRGAQVPLGYGVFGERIHLCDIATATRRSVALNISLVYHPQAPETLNSASGGSTANSITKPPALPVRNDKAPPSPA